MVNPSQTPPGQNILKQGLDLLANLPAPDKLFSELQRLNTNMERSQLDKVLVELQRLNNNFDKLQLYPQDIRALAQVLQNMKVSELLLLLSDMNTTFKKLYEKLWGK
jgi:hypothetical protein